MSSRLIRFVLLQQLHAATLSWLALGLASAFVVNTHTEAEAGVAIEEVRVSYGEELETILREAANSGDINLVRSIFTTEVSGVAEPVTCRMTSPLQIDALQNWVRKRAFDHIEQGVLLKGDNVRGAKLLVDNIKVKLTLYRAVIIYVESILYNYMVQLDGHEVKYAKMQNPFRYFNVVRLVQKYFSS